MVEALRGEARDEFIRDIVYTFPRDERFQLYGPVTHINRISFHFDAANVFEGENSHAYGGFELFFSETEGLSFGALYGHVKERFQKGHDDLVAFIEERHAETSQARE